MIKGIMCYKVICVMEKVELSRGIEGDGAGVCSLGYALQFYFLFLFFFCLCWVFIAARGLSVVAASRGYSLLWCVGFSLRWLLLLQSTGSRHVGFSSCGTRA